MATCSGRLIGSQSVRVEIRNFGSSLRTSSTARLASSSRPLSARVAAIMVATMRNVGRFFCERSAHSEAASISTGKEMRHRDARLHAIEFWVNRAEPHSPLEV